MVAVSGAVWTSVAAGCWAVARHVAMTTAVSGSRILMRRRAVIKGSFAEAGAEIIAPMLRRVVRVVLPRAMALEGLYAGVWIAGLLPGLGRRDALELMLIGLRAAVGAVEIVAAWLLLRGSMSSRPLAVAALVVSAVLVPFETGWRLVPTNLDPTYRW